MTLKLWIYMGIVYRQETMFKLWNQTGGGGGLQGQLSFNSDNFKSIIFNGPKIHFHLDCLTPSLNLKKICFCMIMVGVVYRR